MFERFNRRSATITATALIATMGLSGAAIAKSGTAKHPARAVVAQSQTSSESTSGPDTDSVESGDQNTPDVADSASAASASETTDMENASASDGPGGHADEPGNANANNQAQGEG